MNSQCTNLFYLSALACKIADCLSEDELTILAIDLTTLGDMLATIATRQAICSSDDLAPK